MTLSSSALHVYDREIDGGERTSLSVLSTRIPPAARVLDLGCGSGAIGRFLARRGDGAVIDGLTLNTEEAALAAPHYRRVEVANLDSADLAALFAGNAYDVIVCADVLEHTRHPQQVLASARRLLADDGRVLISIPNASYCGLIAELMAGEFRYRPEGLLDETHLRFFTRRALLRFLAENGWAADSLETIRRALPESEFRAAFDALPASVARHLLAQPDALTYQFIVVARAAAPGETVEAPPLEPLLPAQALFSSELYLGQPGGGFAEAHKLCVAGVMGEPQQTLRFALPPGEPPKGLKFDPADRPGFFHLHAITLRDANGQTLWQWRSSDAATLLQAKRSGIALQPPATPQGAFTLLLLDDDPWLELPIAAEALAQAAGGVLEVTAGWPMSADWQALAGAAQREIADIRQQAGQQAQAAQQFFEQQRAEWERQMRQQEQQWRGQMQACADALHAAEAQSRDLARQVTALDLQNGFLRDESQALHERASLLTRDNDGLRRLLHDIENSTVFRATRPIVHAKMSIDRLLGIGSARPKPAPAPQPLTPSDAPVDIIVPVYRGLQDTRRCIESVLASGCKTAWRLIVINDASPEPELAEWLRAKAASEPRITLLENEQNLGFVGTVNRGMALSDAHDVLLLNSDAEVAGDWLDRIRAAAYGDQRVATVTPFSNNATICSYPQFCKDNELPAGYDTARLDALFARANAGQAVDVPTGVGFCMYIRRAALQAVGLFDEEHFGKGYGEENDFCIRAAQAGWRNLHALDTFVRHFGGVSFGEAKRPRASAMQTLRRLHPRYEGDVLRFVQADPARPARMAVDVARILAPNQEGQPRPVILAVLHDRQGGTERHVHELAAALRERAQFIVLRPLPGQRVSLRLPDPDEGFELVFSLQSEYPLLLDVLRQFGVCHIHYHHLLGHGDEVRRLPLRLGVGYDFTAHDFYLICPEITLTGPDGRYCGEDGPPGGSPAALAAWRQSHIAFANQARYFIGPGRDVLQRLARYLPGAPLRHVPHTDIDPARPLPAPHPRPLQGGRPLKVAVVGALSAIKGADVLEDVATAARKSGAPVEFHLIGYGYRTLRARPQAHLTTYGSYEEKDLPELLDWLAPDLVWFPAQWPETYSYTLSACLLGGWPVVAPDLGAFAERLQGRGWTWLQPWDQTPAQWLAFFTGIRERHYITGQAPQPCAAAPQDEPTHHIAPAPARSLDWYLADYLARLPAVAPAVGGPDFAVLQAHLPAQGAAHGHGPRAAALRLLVWLRGLPLLAGLARAIPPHWQTRVKSWLVK